MPAWRNRLLEAVDRDGRSDRSISLEAGLGPNFLNQLRNEAKEPGIEKIAALAKELGISVYYLFTGLEASEEDDQFLRLYLTSPHAERLALRALLESRHGAGR
jgi:transcriptional regulator with XRE-family HTH domain